MMKWNPLQIGVILSLVALVMALTDLLWTPFFIFRPTDSIAIPLWVLFAALAALQFVAWNQVRKDVTITDEEIARWGGKLELATPAIVEQIQGRTPVKAIAANVKKSYGIPPDVTLRYILALERHVGGDAPEA